MFLTGIMLNRKPGGNGAHSDQADNPEEAGKIVGVLTGTDGWAQLFGEGKFMMITGSDGAFNIAVTIREQPPRKFVASRIDIARVVEAAKAFAEDGRMLKGLTWSPDAVRPLGQGLGAVSPAAAGATASQPSTGQGQKPPAKAKGGSEPKKRKAG